MADPSPIPPPPAECNGESTREARSDGAAAAAGRPSAAARRPVLWPTPESPEPAVRLAELRRDWQARLKPIDEAERAAVDAIVGSVRRRVLLERAELRVLGDLAEGRVEPGMPSLATLGRHAARIERDRALAERELRDLYRLRPVPIPRPDLNPERLEWLAAHVRRRAIESAEALAAHTAAPAAANRGTQDPGPAKHGPAVPSREATPTPAAEPAPRRTPLTSSATGTDGWRKGADAGPGARQPAAVALGDPLATVSPLATRPVPPRTDWLGSTSAVARLAAGLAAGDG